MATDLVLVTATPTIDTAVYASGDRLGSVMTLAGMGQANAGTGFIVHAECEDDALNTGFDIQLWLFRVTPTMANADNGVFDLTDANMATADIVGVIDFYGSSTGINKTRGTTGRVTQGMNAYASLGAAPMAYKTATADTALYGVFKAMGAYDAAATDDLLLKIHALRLT